MSAFASNFPDDSWVVSAQITEVEPHHQYIRSLYWTITTMTTVGYGDITPQRSEEYLIAMVVMLLGASLYAFLIGNVASLFSNLDAAKVQYWNRMEAITQYLQYRKISDELNTKVRNFYEYMWTHRRGIQDEKILVDLPGPLRLEILLHLAKELLEKVPLFRYCSASLRNTLLDALVPHTYPPDGFIAQEGELGKEIFFISKGKLEVSSKNGEKIHAILEEGEYFGDLSLLMKESRTASVRTLSYCEIFILELEDFIRIKNDYPEFKEVIKKISAERTEKTTRLILEGVII
jgi:voltage-gated potassium channel